MTSKGKKSDASRVGRALLPGLLVLLELCGFACAQGDVNIARGKKYTLAPRPGYAHCTDAADTAQLTDGVGAEGYFWTQAATVGWSGASMPTVTIDLGEVLPICGASFNTAAGVAGVKWPVSLFLFVSDDGRAWTYVGDLVELTPADARPEPEGYSVYCFRTEDLAARGRYVKVVCSPGGTYTFVDEIEVYRGPAELRTTPVKGVAVADVGAFFREKQTTQAVRRRLAADVAEVRRGLGAVDEKRSLLEELAAIEREIADVEVAPGEDFRTVFPINAMHGRIFAVQGAAWRGKGIGPLTAWRKRNHWEMVGPTEPPQEGGARVDVAMMRNEYRSGAFNLTNADTRDVALELAIVGLPGGRNPEWIAVHEVPFTDTKSGVPVAAALPLADKAGEWYRVTIPQGMTRQAWLTFHSRGQAAGEYSGEIVIKDRAVRVPVHVKVYPLDFPERPTLHLGGWDYTDQDGRYEVTPGNRAAFIRHLREHFVDSPWATSAVMPKGKYDAAGRMKEAPSLENFTKWVERWPGAANYYVFASVGQRFCGFEPGTAAFERAVSEWIRWWVAAIEKLGIRPEQLGLLLVDEPHARDQDEVIIAYTKVIRAVAPGVVIWNDPTWRKPWEATPELFELSTVLCPNLPMWIGEGERFAEFYVKQHEAGRELWFYSCSGPGKLLDPYSYHRMQAWFCWRYGAKGQGFWAFGDSNGSSSWNEYGSRVGAYTPLFLDADSVTAGKHMEAIREGVEDYESLHMLAERIGELERSGVKGGAVADAKRLLASAAGRVTACMSTADMIRWSESKDRSVADAVRIEVLEMLVRLQSGKPVRTVAEPLSEHPGNIYLEGQTVEVVMPEGTPTDAVGWRVLDDAAKEIGRDGFRDSAALPANIVLGTLPVGWYRVEFLNAAGACVHWTTAAVLKKLAVPTPEDSPICVDSATAWFANGLPDDQARLASLAALAGVNWVRDRLTWGQLEPERGRFTEKETTYDTAAAIQSQHGLKVLQVFHGTPQWGWDTDLDGGRPGGRFPRDLRDAYGFCKAMAERFKGRVQAWEPWNEANIEVFGGHTVDEMCSYQKAAYLGFKAGDPDVTVGWNVYTTIPTQEHTQGLLANETWPYYDTYNIHTYEWAHDYAGLWGAAREAACGKPLWVTEADRGLKYVTPEPWCELSRADEIQKAEYIPQSYASSLHAGSVRHFHFILGHYYETHNGAQFGLLRKDMTPRPAYVALAAAGRLLAGAKCLGRWVDADRPDLHVYAFRARPDGVERDVLAAWAEKKVDWPERRKTRAAWALLEGWTACGVYDYLGRTLESVPEELGSAAVYIVLPAGRLDGVTLERFGQSAPRAGTANPIVLQVQMPKANLMKVEPRPWSQGWEYRIAAGRACRLAMYVYNFSDRTASGRVAISGPPEWLFSQRPWDVSMEPMGRRLLECDLLVRGEGSGSVRLCGDFGELGTPVLSFRVNVHDEAQ